MTYLRATLLINFLPTLHLLSVLALWRTPALALLTLYLVPPLLARLVMAVFGKPVGLFPVQSRSFLVWWSLASLQSIFLRLPFLEELLRMVPTLYSNWLRLWGSRIGKNVYWAPGTVVVDRSYLDIGHQVVMGLSCSFNPHYISHEQLTLAPVTVGDNSQVGGQSVLMSGCEVGPNEYSLATLRMRPFSRFVEGKLWRGPRVSDDQEG